jgi:hypothetical protein
MYSNVKVPLSEKVYTELHPLFVMVTSAERFSKFATTKPEVSLSGVYSIVQIG